MKSDAPAICGRAPDVVVGRVGPAVRDVGPHRVGEEEGVLEDDADLAAERIERDVAHVDAVDRDRALLHVVEAREQQAHRRLARTRHADECDGLAGRDAQREVGEHRLRAQVAEVDVLDDDLASRSDERRASGFSVTTGFESRMSKMRSAAARVCCDDRDDVGHHAHRCEQLREIGGEREEGAERDLALDRQVAAERQHADLAVRRDRREERRVLRLDADVAHP